MEWTRTRNQSQFEYGLELDEPQLGFGWWCMGWCIQLEYLRFCHDVFRSVTAVHVYMEPIFRSPSSSAHSEHFLAAGLKTKARPPQLQASSARDDRSPRGPFAISSSPQFTNLHDRLPSQDWPISPWAVSSFLYVPGHVPRVLGHPYSPFSSALFRCSFERKCVSIWTPADQQVLTVHSYTSAKSSLERPLELLWDLIAQTYSTLAIGHLRRG